MPRDTPARFRGGCRTRELSESGGALHEPHWFAGRPGFSLTERERYASIRRWIARFIKETLASSCGRAMSAPSGPHAGRQGGGGRRDSMARVDACGLRRATREAFRASGASARWPRRNIRTHIGIGVCCSSLDTACARSLSCSVRSLDLTSNRRGCGGIGRRAGFRCQWP